MSTFKYFSDTTELNSVYPLRNDRFTHAFPGVRGVRYDSFNRMVGEPVEGPRAVMPVTRAIEFKSNPSLHKCDARCQHAKGRKCECSCGGKYHGHAG